MELADILAEDSVLTCTGVTDKRQLFEILAQKAAERTSLSEGEIVDALMAREELGSTGLGNGIAIPHGKLKGLDGVIAVFARLDEPIEFDSVDDQPVDLVMLLLAPVGAGADHLKALSRVARMLRTESVVDVLRSDADTARMRDVLTAPAETNCAA
ncbi:PTS IIA-like nitrogen regulatory protein PtsN [Devosia chinhatensis]|uniref:Nitrogen regulatory protein n=1 Tax=Devosia chinhatensis TaxID=429727 RepID=A0A0F5FG42_9HYPH|nr:PTS IIA-like nitrogen regulatory protein PtsN [Devosia chinhatensis]KKB07874.1 nitrogen regulatory protein [Devosia chinhatensis]